MSEFIQDASVFLRRAAKHIAPDMSREEVVFATLCLALGMERVLKGILHSLNPVYVYRSQDFGNTVSLLYKSKLLPSARLNRELAKEPDADVLTFKLSLLRARAVSETTDRHANLLFALSNSRDIIAHNTLGLLDVQKSRMLLLRDFYPLIRDYCGELGIPVSSLVRSHEVALASTSADYQESVQDRVQVKLEAHRTRWEQLQNVPGFVEKMRKRTESLVQRASVEVAGCPACENDALLYWEREFDYIDGESLAVGVFVSGLRCLFCKLEVDDYQEIDFLNLDDVLLPSDEFEEPF